MSEVQEKALVTSRIRFGLVLLFTCTSSMAHADWQYTNWGMAPDQVVSSSGGAAIQLSDAEKAAKSSPKDPTSSPLLKAPYASGKYHFMAYFQFDQRTGKLSSVDLELQDPQLGFDLLGSLRQKYGKPRSEKESQTMNFVVWDAGGDQVSYLWLFTPYVRINHQPSRTIDNKGL